MAYSFPLVGIDDLEDHQEYAAYLSPSSTTFEHNSLDSGGMPEVDHDLFGQGGELVHKKTKAFSINLFCYG